MLNSTAMLVGLSGEPQTEIQCRDSDDHLTNQKHDESKVAEGKLI
jgi:hypothetical protein